MLAPCALGFFASLWGIWVVMGLPLVGSAMVFLLLMLDVARSQVQHRLESPPHNHVFGAKEPRPSGAVIFKVI